MSYVMTTSSNSTSKRTARTVALLKSLNISTQLFPAEQEDESSEFARVRSSLITQRDIYDAIARSPGSENEFVLVMEDGLNIAPAVQPGMGSSHAVPTDSDLRCYARQYPDLHKAFGHDVAKLRHHWQIIGKSEGRTLCGTAQMVRRLLRCGASLSLSHRLPMFFTGVCAARDGSGGLIRNDRPSWTGTHQVGTAIRVSARCAHAYAVRRGSAAMLRSLADKRPDIGPSRELGVSRTEKTWRMDLQLEALAQENEGFFLVAPKATSPQDSQMRGIFYRRMLPVFRKPASVSAYG